VLQSSYDAYAKRHVNRRLIVPMNAVADSIDMTRNAGIKTTKKANEIVDNSFAENLEKSGFLKELWTGNCRINYWEILSMLHPSGLVNGHYECRSFAESLPILKEFSPSKSSVKATARRSLNIQHRLANHRP